MKYTYLPLGLDAILQYELSVLIIQRFHAICDMTETPSSLTVVVILLGAA